MLDANMKAQLAAYLERMTQPVEIVATLDDTPASADMRALLKDVAEASPRVTVTEARGGPARTPSFSINRPGEDSGVRFAGLLTGVLRELTAARKHRTESERLVESLTPREREVLRCMVAGLGRKAVAERLYLSPHTVRTHMQNVLGKLGVHSTLAAVALARRAGVGPVDLGPAGRILPEASSSA